MYDMKTETSVEALGELLRAAREFQKIPKSQAAAISLNDGRSPRSPDCWERLDKCISIISEDLDKFWYQK